jgi:transglutaminase-like putative cysteine protease
MRKYSPPALARPGLQILKHRDAIKSLSLVMLMLLSTFATIDFYSYSALAASDQDGDGLTYGLEYLMNTQPNDPDSDNDGLPDGWEWQYGLNPLSSQGIDGATGDPDGDSMTNLMEYNYLIPSGWDSTTTANLLDKGVWWNGTVPVNNWDEENAMQYTRVACGGSGTDGTGSVILCDEDPVGNICANGFDDDKDGFVDSADPDNDGDLDCSSNDDDGDGVADEDVAGWDTDGDGMPDGWEAANGLNATQASNMDGANGDPDGDGLTNLMEYVNPSWTTMCGTSPCFRNGPNGIVTETISPCNPAQGIGPGACATITAEVDGIMSTNPQKADTDGDGLNDSYEALTLLTDPTSADTDNDGIDDGVEVNGAYGNPPQASDPRNNNTDGDAFDDGAEDLNGNGIMDAGETDPTRREDSGDADGDGIQNWEENLSCTTWDVADTDFGGINDGDERNVSHGTDPCDSIINYSTPLVSWNSGTSQLTVSDGSGFNPSGGVGWYNASGTTSSFAYAAVVNNVIQGVSIGPGLGVATVENRNGSFCHYSATQAGTILTTGNYCDDDYTDSDGDGLADWQELLATFGWFSNPSLSDTDGDGVNDYDEVRRDGTDPTQPCSNLLDDDLDGLNNYFEVTTGCDLSWIGISNGSQDVWITDISTADTDGGGVDDTSEYFDGTNPENDPSDDLLPDDFDGDGIPDAIENQTGTDWTNPDTDGGGMLDGDECPIQFWFVNCVGAPFNPWDPTDDTISNEVVFWANNTTGAVDVFMMHRWRQTTNDFYTGTTYAHLGTVHPSAVINLPTTNKTDLGDLTFANDTILWTVQMNNPIMNGAVPMPDSWTELSFWADAIASLDVSNDTYLVTVNPGPISELWVNNSEYYFDWDNNSASSIASPGFAYELALDSSFKDLNHTNSGVFNITNAIINDAGATDAYSKASAISDFLINGNLTTEFKRNYNGSGAPSEEDLTNILVGFALEGTCSEFSTAFVTMARLAGLPARYVTGYAGGTWTGSGYEVYSEHRSTWGEVKLQQNSANGNLDMGWVAFDACPAAEEIEIVNQSASPLTWDRDGQTNLSVSGQLRFVGNSTPISEIQLIGYLVPLDEADQIPGAGGDPGRIFSSSVSSSDGNFSMNGIPTEAIRPGIHRLVVEHFQSGYVSHNGIVLDMYVNVTDDSMINHTSPQAIDSPVAGAGATTIIQGLLLFENPPTTWDGVIENQTVWLEFTSSVSGITNLSGDVGPGGVWSIVVDLDPLEFKTNISATLGYSGWTDNSVTTFTPPQFHLRPSTHVITLDIRDAPNLTATLEGPLANNSVFVLGDDIFINGSAMSIGATPVALLGNLSLSIRQNGSGMEWLEVFNFTVNGSFTISHLLVAGDTPVAAGEIEIKLRFFPDILLATDDANVSVNVPYWLQGILDFSIAAMPQMRGTATNVRVQIEDHRGVIQGFETIGNYDFYFDGNWVNTTTDPDSTVITLSWNLNASKIAYDYFLDISFNGSQYFQPSIGVGTLRTQAEVGWNISVGQDWNHLGTTTYIYGDIFDPVHLTPITGNDSILTILMQLPDGNVLDISQGMLNNSTGTFNISVTMPINHPSNAYDFSLAMDFDAVAQVGGAFYQLLDLNPPSDPPQPPNLPSVLVGIESEFVIQSERSKVIVEMNNSVFLNASIFDVADMSNVSDATVEFIFDYGNTNISIGSVISDGFGNVSLSWSPVGISPGYYDLRMVVYDDLTDGLSQGNSRRYGNDSIVNITVQVNSDFRIDSIPNTVTAGINFNVLGQVLDADNGSRPLISGVALTIFWLENPNETLIEGYITSSNGTFNISIPTDTLNNGTVRGMKTLVISVVEGSSPFYLTASSQHGILVMGVSRFENLQPLNPIIINRGDSVNITSKLVESSNMWQPLAGYDVAIEFHETWLAPTITDGEGFANFTHVIPTSHPLGLISVNIVFNGSSDLLSTNVNLSTITIRAVTILVVDAISANPVAGQSFDVSGRVVSDNGSGLEQRDGTNLMSNILFKLDGNPTEFTVANGSVMTGGFWNATITLSQTFMAGNHVVEASYVPNVNFYLGSNDNTTFDSRGYTTLVFIKPSIDGLGQPSLNDRTNRGDNVSLQILLRDNTGESVPQQAITVEIIGTSISAVFTTANNGTALGILNVPSNLSVGPADLRVTFGGIPGTTGLLGSNATTQFVVLAETNLTITQSPSSLTAGDSFTVNGTLLDDLGLPLYVNGIESLAIVHLLVDGIPVSSVETDAMSGAFSLSWVLPEDTSAGAHQIEVRFTGGRDWVDPIGVGDPANPDYYHPSSDIVAFNVSVPTKILLITPTGDVDREDSMTIQGRLLDLVDEPLPNMVIEIWLDGKWLTNVTTDVDGMFTAVHAVPANANLGPLSLETRFTGTTFFLPSQESGTWNVFSKVLVTVEMPSPVAVSQNISITGSVVDNQLNPIFGHQVELNVEGVLIAIVTTDAQGEFSYDWTIPDIFSFGNHTMDAISPAQGFYRSNTGNTTFFLAHRSGVTLIFDDGRDATRGDTWALSGRLFDIDTVNRDGLEGMMLSIILDDVEVATATTDNSGVWSVVIPATMELSRGEHTFTVSFAGTNAHLEASTNAIAIVWSDMVINIDETSSKIVIRSDGTFAPIILTGSIAEIGGQGEVFENLVLHIGNGTDCVNNREGASCIGGLLITWLNGNFSVSGPAPSWMESGSQWISIDAPRNDSLYLNGESISQILFVKVNADFSITIDKVVEDKNEDISGTVIITAQDTGAGIPGISVTIYLYDGNNTQLSNPLQKITDENGRVEIVFNSDPPYGDASRWGEVSMDIIINDPRLSDESLATFAAIRQDGFAPDYSYADDVQEVSMWAYVLMLLIAALGAAGVVLYKRKKSAELMADAAEIFAYTAELLAAGDSIREAIFNCYQDLCSLLQQRDFLRRDFETVREFEVAIRQAMPGISNDALVAMDNTFEMARYSREEMGGVHQEAAVQALNRMSAEISQLQTITART